MRKLDYEFIFTCGIVAFIAALGMVAGIVVLAGAKIYVYNLPLIVGSFLVIGGLLWGLLLVLNNDKVEKRTKHRYCSDSLFCIFSAICWASRPVCASMYL